MGISNLAEALYQYWKNKKVHEFRIEENDENLIKFNNKDGSPLNIYI